MDLSKLSVSERAALKAQLDAEEKAERSRIERERETYKQLVDATVKASVTKLQSLSTEMMRIKQEVFNEFGTVINLKNELFKTKSGRQTDTFTTSDSRMSLTLGNRVNEGWDDTVEAGIDMVSDIRRCFAAPKGIKPAELDALRVLFKKICEDPEYLADMKKAGQPAEYMDGEAFAAYIAGQQAHAQEALSAAGLLKK